VKLGRGDHRNGGSLGQRTEVAATLLRDEH
jgi:hypothetical protein